MITQLTQWSEFNEKAYEFISGLHVGPLVVVDMEWFLVEHVVMVERAPQCQPISSGVDSQGDIGHGSHARYGARLRLLV